MDSGEEAALGESQRRLLRACKARTENPRLSFRYLAELYGVSRPTLQRAAKRPATAKAILDASAGRGRRQRLQPREEQLIADTIVEF
eukprot:IDg22720t1